MELPTRVATSSVELPVYAARATRSTVAPEKKGRRREVAEYFDISHFFPFLKVLIKEEAEDTRGELGDE